MIFGIIRKLLKFDKFFRKCKLNFTNSFIYVHSSLEEIIYKWGKIQKAILTKGFFFLYVKERNGYIISISNKHKDDRDINRINSFCRK